MPCCTVCRSCYDGDPSHKKDSAWAWIVCAAASTNLGFTLGLIFSFGVLLPVFMDYFKESRGKTAWIGSLSMSLCFFFGPFASSLVNRFGCRAMSIIGCLTCALSLTIASFANNFIILYVTYGVLGVSTTCVFVSSLKVVRNCFDKRQSIAIGIASTGQGLGIMGLSQVLQSLATALSWRNSLRIVAGALALNGVLPLLFDPDIEPVSSSELPSSREQHGQRQPSKRFSFHFSVWKVPRFLALAATGFLFMFGRSVIFVHLVKFSEERGIPSSASARLNLFVGITVAVGRLAGGFLCSFKKLDNFYILQGMSLVNGVSTVLFALAHKYGALVAYALVFGFSDGAMITVVNITALTCVDQSRAASSFGFYIMIVSATSLAGPPISGLMADELGSYEPAFYMAGGAYIAASLVPCVLYCVRTSWETNRKELSPNHEENTEDSQELEMQSHRDGLCVVEPLKVTSSSKNRQPCELGHKEFVSTV